MFTNRQCKLINLLLNSSSGISGRQLASLLEVSSRTVRTDISQINQYCHSFDISITSDNISGYSIQPRYRSLFYHLVQEPSDNFPGQLPATPSERLVYLLFRFLFSASVLPMESLAEELYTSKSTISYDLKKINLIVEKETAITLEILPLHGIILQGSELAKRKFLFHIISTYYTNNRQALYKTLHLFDINPEEDYLSLYERYVNELNQKNIVLTDKGLTLLILNTLVVQKRIASGLILEQEYSPVFSDLLFQESVYKTLLPQTITAEYYFLNDCICSKPTMTINMSHSKFSEQAEHILNEYIETLWNQYHIEINKYEEGKKQLLLHIASIIGRSNMNELESSDSSLNPQFSYPFAFELATVISPIFKRQLSIRLSAVELSYIAVHIAVILEHIAEKKNIVIVCNSNLGTARLVSTQLERFFRNQFQVLACCPFYQLTQVLENVTTNVDYIFSTTPLQYNTEIPTLQLNTLFTPADIERLIDILYSSHYNLSSRKTNLSLNDLLSPNLFVVINEEVSDKQILKKMTNMLAEQRYIESFSAFYYSVLERENLYSTLYDKLWLPHPMKSFSNKTTACIALVNTPTAKKLVFMLAINANEPEQFKFLYSKLVALINNSSLVNTLLTCTDYWQLLNLLNTI